MQFFGPNEHPKKLKKTTQITRKLDRKTVANSSSKCYRICKEILNVSLMKIEVKFNILFFTMLFNGRVHLVKAEYQEQNSDIKTPKQFHATVIDEKKSCPTFFGVDTFCLNVIIEQCSLSTFSCKKAPIQTLAQS